MSSTNRSEARDLHISDYYITPVNRIIDFLNEFNKHENVFKENIKILDCSAGGDKEHGMSYPEALNSIGCNDVTTIDIREDSLADIKGNYLEIDCKGKYDVIITNPPFTISRSIIDKALDDVSEGVCDNATKIKLSRWQSQKRLMGITYA